MENQNNATDQNTQQIEQNPVSQPIITPEKPKMNYLMIGGIIVACLVFFGFGGYYLGKQSSNSQKYADGQPLPTQSTQNNPSTIPLPTSETSNGLKSYSIKSLGLEYQLPPSLSKFGNLTDETIPGEKGNQFCITFPRKTSWLVKTVYAGGAHCPIVHFGFGTTSIDYEAGRSGGFTDFQGFEITNGKYYGRFPGNKTFEIPSDIVEEVKNPNGITLLKIRGKKYEKGPSPFVYEGSIGALVNIANNPNYRGIAIQLELSEGYTEKEFDKILSSLKFVK